MSNLFLDRCLAAVTATTSNRPAEPATLPAPTPGGLRSAAKQPSVQPLPLTPRRDENTERPKTTEPQRKWAPWDRQAVTSTAAGLAVVLGLFFVVVAITRRIQGRPAGELPVEVVEVLGKTLLQGKQQLQLVRVGHKLLLLLDTPGGIQRLSEIDDRAEVERLARLCQGERPRALQHAVRDVLSHLERTEEGNASAMVNPMRFEGAHE